MLSCCEYVQRGCSIWHLCANQDTLHKKQKARQFFDLCWETHEIIYTPEIQHIDTNKMMVWKMYLLSNMDILGIYVKISGL